MSMLNACTIIARNYLPYARVLAESFTEHHPRGRLTVLVIDDVNAEVDERREPFSVARIPDIGFDPREFHRMAMIYDVMELATAVKPTFLRHLLSSGASEIIYLDPDIQVFAPLDDIAALARQHAIVLIPHTTGPIPRDDHRPSESDILAAGIFNLGFIALGPGCELFLDWWTERCLRDCLSEPARMRFVDQRWIDLASTIFSHHVLDDQTCNVGYWNLHERDILWTGERYEVSGRPLRFFHFSGFRPEVPYLLSKHQVDRPRILLSERPGVAQLCRAYAERLLGAGYAATTGPAYGFDLLPNGLRVSRRMRRLYREALLKAEREGADEPPNPFDLSGSQHFLAWLNEPVEPLERPQVSRYLAAIHTDRPDLQTSFPSLARPHADHYLDWIHHDGRAQENIPPELLPAPKAGLDGSAPESPVRAALRPGVNVAGYFRAELGVGEAARRLIAALKAADIPHATIPYSATPSRQDHPFEASGAGDESYDTNLVCVNADQTPYFARDVGPGFFAGRYTIGYWYWEVENFPPSMHPAFDVVDEVWVGSEFVAKSVAAVATKPVHTVPPPIIIPTYSADLTRADLGLPERYIFLFVFDFFSILERKNPFGLIEAFKRAFAPDEGPLLYLKTINGDKRLVELERLRAAIGDRPDILLADGYLPVDRKNALIGLADCYVSLHRSEGFGLTMAEAMALGKPVIATAYSGNVDFMNPANSYLVDYALTTVPPGCAPYPVGTPWAEPNLDEAARLMRYVFEHPVEATEKARLARDDIHTRHSPQARGTLIGRHLDRIRRVRIDPGCAEARDIRQAPDATRHIGSGSAMPGLARAIAHLAPGPAPTGSGRARLVGTTARRALLRVLRPYWWNQRTVDQGLIEAVRTVADGLQASRSDLAGAVQQLRTESVATAAAIEQLRTESAATVAAIEQLSNTSNQARADLAGAIEQLRTESAGLRAIPYMAEPNLLATVDDLGRPAIGYRGYRGGDANHYRGFEDIFRGPEEFISERQRSYLSLVEGRGPVLDVGCGRGEFLDLLAEVGIRAVGVDLDSDMVERCRAKGHAAELADAVSYLNAQPDDSIGAVFSAQVIEHLAYDDLVALLNVAERKLSPGGVFIAETVNPHAVHAFKTYWVDLTHRNPIFPEVAVALSRLAGFEAAVVQFPLGSGNLEADRFTQGEYAVVATKASTR
jgi:glycosyltransferase involved in cell wall biosynthesis/SAM-dependent methyltransferase